MYAYISGTVSWSETDSVILDNHGIGYRIYVPGSVVNKVSHNEEVRLYTHYAVREDGASLFGFLTREELELFELLIGVSGIGPKGALGILSVMDADDLRFAVLSEDAQSIAKAPGIGKKTAQKVILELKDKLSLEDAFESKAAHTEETAQGASDSQSEAVQALAALGYSNSESMKAVRKAAEALGDADVETLIKAALRELF